MSSASKLWSYLKTPLLRFGRLYVDTAEKHPAATGIVTTVVKTSAADLFAQKVLERKEEVDWRRHGMFVGFGLFYLGGFQYYLYNHLFVKWCSGITAVLGHHGSAPVKTFIDQAIHHPFFYFPAFYMLKGGVEGRPLQSTVEKYRAELWDNCKALWMLWVPAQLVNFAVVPRHLRIPFVAGVSFAWTVVLSLMRGALEQTSAQPQVAAMSTHASTSPSADASLTNRVAAPALMTPLAPVQAVLVVAHQEDRGNGQKHPYPAGQKCTTGKATKEEDEKEIQT